MLKWRTDKLPARLIASVVLMVLLVWLAALQYRWLGQVSDGEHVRLQTTLKAGATRFSEDFDRELTRAYNHFQLSASLAGNPKHSLHAERYAYWQRKAPYPQLVEGWFLISPKPGREAELSRFNPASGHFEPCAWPAELAKFRRRFINSNPISVDNGALVHPAIDLPDCLLEEVPALAIPLLPGVVFGLVPSRAKQRVELKPAFTPATAVAELSGYTVVLFDRSYLNEQFLPLLARRYFAGAGNSLEYQLAIVSRRDPSHLLYSSQPQMRVAPSEAYDATAGLFSLRMDYLHDNSVAQAPVIENAPSLTFSPPLYFSATAVAPAGDMVVFTSQPAGAWQLLIRHRAGSLDAAVGRLRRRNLLLSFSTLSLLAGSMALVYFSAQRARRLARQQLEFVAGVSHELRLPVSVVCMASANLAEGMIREEEQVRQYGQLLRAAGRRLSGTIEQVLDFAGTEMLRKPYHFAPVALPALIESALQACRADWPGPFEVETALAPELPPVKADQAALTRALQNLLSNALKYSGERAAIRLSAVRHGTEVRLTVEDRGIGIEASELRMIFEPFRRGQAALAAQIPGNGLGLHLVKRVMEAHGGAVSVRSQPGAGSSFTLHLPVHPF